MTAAPRHVACSDCERIRPGPVAQPVNALSSLAFVAAATPAVRTARRHEPMWWAVAAALVATGLGSVAYHGPGGRGARAAHDSAVLALVISTAAALARRPSRAALSARTAALGAAALALHAASRTDRPLCRPDSRLQGHAGFHLLAAAGVASAALDQRRAGACSPSLPAVYGLSVAADRPMEGRDTHPDLRTPRHHDGR